MIKDLRQLEPLHPANECGGGVIRHRRIPILLASRSPRRRQLLDQWGFEHIALSPGFEDGMLTPGEVTPAQWVASLAYLKAWAGAMLPEAKSGGGHLVVGADTTCVLDGKMLGTPTTVEEAEAMIRAFAQRIDLPEGSASGAQHTGRLHEVLTGVAIVDVREGDGLVPLAGTRTVFVDGARVRMGELTDQQISEYVASGEWKGKAGGYNLAERLAAGWPITFEGDQTTIMGLPMERLSKVLRGM